MPVEKGSKVKIDYIGTLDDGSVFDSSEKHGKPLEFEAGAGKVIPGLDSAIISMELDEEKDITVKPEEAYGEINVGLTRKLDRKLIPQDQEPKAGMMLMMRLPDGKQIPATIQLVDEKEVTIDMNHPLAGKTLHFKVKVVGID